MATLKKQKSRKEYVCSKCGAIIKYGEEYYRFSLTRFHKPSIRCIKCRPKDSEMTTSDFWAQIYMFYETNEQMSADEMEDAESVIDTLVGELEELRDDQEARKENMPENLQESSVAELLQSRYDAINEWIEVLQNIDVDIEDGLSVEDLDIRYEDILEEILNTQYEGE